jgi:excisionase family DNA binding protein
MSKENSIDYRSPEWVADKLGIEKNTVYKFLQDGVLPGLQLGRKWLISETDLRDWLADETHRQTESRRTAASSAQRLSGRLGTMTTPVKKLVKHAHSEARRYNHPKLSQGHLLLAYADDSDLAPWLTELGVDFDAFRTRLEEATPTGEGEAPRRLARTDPAKAAIRAAAAIATERGDSQFTAVDLILGMLRAGIGTGFTHLTEQSISQESISRVREN